MRVILIKDVRKLGKKGEIKEVKDGYGQNYLIKNGFAKPANDKNLNELKLLKHREEKQDKLNKEKALADKEKLEKEKFKFVVKTGEHDKMFGSISVKQIKESLEKKGYKIDKKKIDIKNPITCLGFHEVILHLYSGVDAKIRIEITK